MSQGQAILVEWSLVLKLKGPVVALAIAGAVAAFLNRDRPLPDGVKMISKETKTIDDALRMAQVNWPVIQPKIADDHRQMVESLLTGGGPRSGRQQSLSEYDQQTKVRHTENRWELLLKESGDRESGWSIRFEGMLGPSLDLFVDAGGLIRRVWLIPEG